MVQLSGTRVKRQSKGTTEAEIHTEGKRWSVGNSKGRDSNSMK